MDTEPVFTGHRTIWRLAAPIMLSNLSVPLVGIVDTAVMGHLGDPALIGAIALGALIFSFLYWGFGFLKMGTTGIVAQALGAGDNDEIRATCVRTALLALAFAVPLLVCHELLLAVALGVLQASSDVEVFTATYFNIRIWTAPAVLGLYVILGTLIGLQNTRAVLIVQLVLNLTNVVLDFVFVYGFDMQVEGVAIATVISEYLAVFVGAWFVLRRLRRLPGVLDWRRVRDRSSVKRLLGVGGNLFIRTLCLIVGHSWFTARGAAFGELTLAANAVLMLLVNLMSYALDGFAHAAEALAGQAWGKRSIDDYRAAVRLSTLWAVAGAAVFSLIYLVFGGLLVDMITSIKSVRTEAREYLLWIAAAPMIVVWAYQFDGIFAGTTHSVEMRNATLFSFAVFAVANLTLVPWLGNHGLWLALIIFMATRSLSMFVLSPRIDRTLAKITSSSITSSSAD